MCIAQVDEELSLTLYHESFDEYKYICIVYTN